MATYKGIKGFNIQTVSSDPPAPFTGEVWFNSTSGTVKYFAVLSAAWATGGNLTTGRRMLGGAGTQTAGLAFGGRSTDPSSNATEEYGGTSWTNGGNMGTGRSELGGTGTQTAGLAFGGGAPSKTDATEEYDGSSWTAGGALSSATDKVTGTGTQTAGLAIGGEPPGNPTALTQEYNGSSWTAGGTLGTGRYLMGAAGTQTAALAFGGAPGNKTNTEEYNGTSWTAGGVLNDGVAEQAGFGLQTAAISTASLNTARKQVAGAGTTTVGLAFGGTTANTPSGERAVVTEEFSGGGPATLTVGTD
jgi:hypothetical protein